MSGRSITFDSNDLQTATILTQNIDSESIPTKGATAFGLSHANGSRIPYINYPSKSIKVQGSIIAQNIESLDDLLDTFRGYFINQDRNLDIGYSTGVRRFIATVNALSISRPGGLNRATFDIEFLCTAPFGREVNQTTAINAVGRTLAAYNDSYTFLGTAPYQNPIITVTYSAVSGATDKSVTIGNNNNGQAITVTRTWIAGDVLQIDSSGKTVTVNGFMVDFTGAFPQFPPGAQSIGYSDSLTSRTFNYNIVYLKMYL